MRVRSSRSVAPGETLGEQRTLLGGSFGLRSQDETCMYVTTLLSPCYACSPALSHIGDAASPSRAMARFPPWSLRSSKTSSGRERRPLRRLRWIG